MSQPSVIPCWRRRCMAVFTYTLHCKASRTSAIWQGTRGDSVHLPTALQSEPNISHVASSSRRFGSLTSCIANRRRTSAMCRPTPSDFVHVPTALQGEPNVSMAGNSRQFGSLTDGFARRAERQPDSEHLPAIRFTYHLHCEASGTSMILRATRRFGSHTGCISTRAERQYVASNYRLFGSLTNCISKRADRQPDGEQFLAIRFTHILYYKTSPKSAMWRATRCDSVHVLSALQDELNVSHAASNSVRFGSLTDCIVDRADCQSHGGQLPPIRLTHQLHCKASRTSAILRATRRNSVHLLARLQCVPNVSHIACNTRQFGSLTTYIAKGAEHQLSQATSGDSIHIPSALRSELSVSYMTSNSRGFGTLTN